jgi:hypothetical protein
MRMATLPISQSRVVCLANLTRTLRLTSTTKNKSGADHPGKDENMGAPFQLWAPAGTGKYNQSSTLQSSI